MRPPNRENLKRFVWEAKGGSKIPFFPPSAPSSSTHHHRNFKKSSSNRPQMARTKVTHSIPFPHSRTFTDFVVIAFAALVVIFVANRPQIHRRSVFIHATFVKCSKLVIPGKAPRKQLATKAARKTAQVRSSSSSPSATSDSTSFFSFLSDRHWRCQEAPQIPPWYRRSP